MAVFVWQVEGRDEYLVYELRDLQIEVSNSIVRGQGRCSVVWVNHDGQALEGRASTALPVVREVAFVLRWKETQRGSTAQATLGQMRPVAEKFLFDTKR